MATTPTATQESTGKGHIGRIVAGSLVAGFAGAVALVAGPFAGAREHVITGSVLVVFAIAWAAIALLAERRTDQPQRWAIAPAALMFLAGVSMLVLAPTGNELGWVWPPALATLVVWMIVRSRRALRSRTRVLLLYPVFAALLLAAAGGAYETYREAADRAAYPMPGRLIDVGGHKLHLDCTGTGSPTVVLEPGLGEPSTAMAWIAPDVATTTRVCVYDRAGRGWSESSRRRALDGFETAADLHTLLARAGEHGPFVFAGHSAGGIYVLDYAARYPEDVAGVVLLDSMSPDQYTKIESWPAFYETFRRASAVLPSLSRFGVGRVVHQSAYGDLPALARDEQRAFWATPRHARSVRDEFSRLRTAMAQAKSLTTLAGRPLVVLTAEKGAAGGWSAAQAELAALSTDSVHRFLPAADHEMLTEQQQAAEQSAQAIRDVVDAVRTGTLLNAPPRPTALVDELVAVNGGHLHVRCEGAGPTTVVLISGFNVGPGSWPAVEPALAQTARVCSYDRFGDGTSSAPPAPQTFATQAADLHALLLAANEPGPYVVVGHSTGGAEAVMFASMFPREVRGLLLLDASPPAWNTAICSVADDGSDAARSFRGACAEQSDPVNNGERLDGPRAFAEVGRIASLGTTPMIVVTATDHRHSGLNATDEARLTEVWSAGQAHWASLAASAQLVAVENTSHFIQLDQPDVVIEKIRELLGNGRQIAG